MYLIGTILFLFSNKYVIHHNINKFPVTVDHIWCNYYTTRLLQPQTICDTIHHDQCLVEMILLGFPFIFVLFYGSHIPPKIGKPGESGAHVLGFFFQRKSRACVFIAKGQETLTVSMEVQCPLSFPSYLISRRKLR